MSGLFDQYAISFLTQLILTLATTLYLLGLAVIALDANEDTITVLGGRQMQVSSADDPVQMSAQVNRLA